MLVILSGTGALDFTRLCVVGVGSKVVSVVLKPRHGTQAASLRVMERALVLSTGVSLILLRSLLSFRFSGFVQSLAHLVNPYRVFFPHSLGEC